MEILWTCLHEKIVSESYLQIRKVTTQHLSMHTYHTWMPASRRIFHDNLLFACGTESVKAASQLTHTLGPKPSSWHDWWVWWGCWWLVRMKNKRHRIHQKWSSDFTWTMKLKEQALDNEIERASPHQASFGAEVLWRWWLLCFGWHWAGYLKSNMYWKFNRKRFWPQHSLSMVPCL